MKVFLRVMGDALLARLAAEIARPDSAFPRQYGAKVLLQWQLERIEQPFTTALLENTPARTSVVLIQALDAAIVERLWSITSREYYAICRSNRYDYQPAPVILVFDRELPTSHLVDMPLVVTDWITGMDAMQDLARRVFAALRRQKHVVAELGGLPLTLSAESRQLCYDKDAITLTPSEVSVAEMFISRFGSVIPLQEIQLLFKLAGRSTEGSNVRVTMFQLRLKLEALTRCHYTLTSAYGQGYVLRHGKGSDTGHPYLGWEARQPVAVYGADNDGSDDTV